MNDLTRRSSRLLEEAQRSHIPGEMREVLNSLRALADERLSSHQISYKQGVPLRYLSSRSPCNVTELATAASMDIGSMTRMIGRLEAKGLLERRRSSGDRRVVYISLLEAGTAVAAIADEVLASVTEDHLKNFALQERVQLREFLERMRANGRALGDD